MMKADRLALIELRREDAQDPVYWWNKIRMMTDDEMELLPFNYLKKYGTFVKLLEQHETLQKEAESRSYNNRWEEVKNMTKLKTNEEKEIYNKYVEDTWKNGENNPEDIKWENYMFRQPRLNLGNKNFNFEEYKPYV